MHRLVQNKLGKFVVTSYNVKLNAKKDDLDEVVYHTLTTNSEEEVYSYLSSLDVDPCDVEIALNYFEQEGHNKANFGVMGGLVYTEFDGVVQ